MAQATRTRTELNVAPRDVLGKKVKALRRHGLTPANLYGHNVSSTAIQVQTEKLRDVLKRAGRNEIVYLRLDGQDPRPTFVRDVQQNPVTDAILHVDFLQISLREKVKADVPIHLVGLSPAVDTHGGILMHGLAHVGGGALPPRWPSFAEMRLSPLTEINQARHVSDLELPEEVTLLTDPEQVVAKVAPPAVEPEPEVEEEEEAVEGDGAEPEGEPAEEGAKEEAEDTSEEK